MCFIGIMLQFMRRIATTVKTNTPHVNPISASPDRSARALCIEGHLKEAVQTLHFAHKIRSCTYVYVLQCCILKKSLYEAKLIHALILTRNERRFMENIFLQNTLLAMYAKCGSLLEAGNFFNAMVEKDVFSWNVMLAACNGKGFCLETLDLFDQMLQQGNGIQPDEFTFASIIPAFRGAGSLEEGVDIHRRIIRMGFHSDVAVVNALIDMYGKFGRMHKARVLFDKMKDRSMISWNAMITGYAHNGLIDEAERLFKEMEHRNTISWTAMIAGYSQNRLLEAAMNLFRKMPERDTISWTAVISGYAQYGDGLEAIKLFQNMQWTCCRPSLITFTVIVRVCASLAALERGREIHGNLIRSGFFSDVIVINSLIDMYAKCASIERARLLFDKVHCKDTTLWTAMIAGYAMHGSGKEAIELFEQMKQEGASPNHVTLSSVLSACSHAGLVKEGCQYFNSMSEYYRITPAMEHYICMVDLLGRAGHLDEAKEIINSMPIEPDAVVWTCLLGACKIHNNLELAEFVAEQLLQLDLQNSGPFVLLSHIYAMSGRWNEIENVRKMMRERGIQKPPGCSWIEVNKQVHTFVVEDRSHPKTYKFMLS